MLEEGTTAPAFTLPNQHGGTLGTEDLRGSWVALWWYVKASTSG